MSSTYSSPCSRSRRALPPKGFVQGIATYTVIDNLTVSPMSSIITPRNTFAVTDLGALKETTGLAILKASLQSTTVLSDVFLAMKPARQA
ncbi:hypothetical protein E2562_023331 [Oryza meyeriana var. granulata]|uniref:Uncharacterized protein n=1 Tax=Oryza meyeriana var. granulata TaxID=110450 RepID=A0A6G1E0D1_9ORYZ|nr:hypothetical protein E2562_023331 [Oryza meyeriana var. granulata]